MLRVVLIAVGSLMVSFSAIAQHDYFESFVNTSAVQSPGCNADFARLVGDLKTKQAHLSQTEFLKKAFQQAHKKLLRHYKPYSSFTEMFQTGAFDCLSGTALFSLLLNEFGYEYKIIETNYHIFLLVETRKGRVLIESTDRVNGFVTGVLDVNNRMESYRKNQLPGFVSHARCYSYSLNLFHEVLPQQLTGLLYFNQAVVAYNHRAWAECIQKLAMAELHYPNPRIDELREVLKLTYNPEAVNVKISSALDY